MILLRVLIVVLVLSAAALVGVALAVYIRVRQHIKAQRMAETPVAKNGKETLQKDLP